MIDVGLQSNYCLFLIDHVELLAFAENLLKTMSAKGAMFSLKFTKNRLSAGLRSHPLEQLERSSDPLAATGGPILLTGGQRRKRGGKSMGGRGGEGRRKEGGGKRSPFLFFFNNLSTE